MRKASIMKQREKMNKPKNDLQEINMQAEGKLNRYYILYM